MVAQPVGNVSDALPGRPIHWQVAGERRQATGVIRMMVGNQDGDQRKIVLRDKLPYRRGIAGVDHHGAAAVVHEPKIVVIERRNWNDLHRHVS